MPSQFVGSLQYIRYWVQAVVNGNATYNPTSDVVEFGFTTSATVEPSVWYTGLWETDTIANQPAYIAKILVGPAGTFVPASQTTYYVWIRVTDNPEVPVMQPGTLVVQ